MTSTMRVGAVDCGTNSIRLLVADVLEPGSVAPKLVDVVREMRIIRLGEGVDATGRISPEAIERARVELTDYARTMIELGVSGVRMAATSATRDATNRDDFFGMTAEVLGAVVPGAVAEVISGDTEAALTFAGAVADLDPADGPFVVTDLGGGSTEIVVGEVSGGQPQLLGSRSVDIGCVRLTERALHSDPPRGEEIARARAVIAEKLRETADVPVECAARWVGVAGTFTTLSALAQELGEYDSERIHNSTVSLDRMRQVCGDLVAMSVADRLALGPMHPGRADVIGGGSLVAAALCDEMERRAGLHELTVSEKDVLDGIALSVVARLTGV